MTMSLLENLFSQGTIERLGWMLVHILWQATAVAILLAVFLRLLRNSGANARYWIACSALALMVALPIVTIRLIQVPGPAAEASPPPAIVTPPPETTAPAVQAIVEAAEEIPAVAQPPTPLQTADLTTSVPLRERIVPTLEPALPYVVLGWLVGVFGLSAWHLGGWTQLQRLKRRMVRKIGSPLQQRLEVLGVRLGVHGAVGLLESALVEVPTVVGWLRPVILLPASALTGLRPEQLEAILAHELAHIRRYDYLVNIVQTVVEILGFYHPAIWWVSHRIRIERENCCDDLAVNVCGSSLQYARALACMEEIRHNGTDLAIAATGGSLVARIARLLGRPTTDDRRFAWLPGLVALLLVVGLIIPAALVLGTPQPPQTVEPAAAPATSPDHGSTEPNAAHADAESRNAPSDEEAAQILLEFKITKVSDDLRPDRKMLQQMADALGDQSPLARELKQPGRKLDMTLGEILRRFIVPQPLSEQAGEAIIDLLQSRGYMEVSSKPRVLTRDGKQAQIRVVSERFLRIPDSPSGIERVEYGTVVNATAHVVDANRVTLEMMAEVTDLVPGPDDFNQPTVSRTSAETSVTASNDRYLVWAAVTPTAPPAGQEASRQSVYIMVKPRINLPPRGLENAAGNRKPAGTPLRQVLLEVRTVTMEQGALGTLGVEWNTPTAGLGMPPGPSAAGKQSGGIRIGHASDRTFTDALLTALDRLQANHQATVSSQQILTQDGYRSQVKALMEEWSTRAVPATRQSPQPHVGLHKTETGTAVTITPYIGDNNDITIKVAIEASSSLPKAQGSDLPLMTRRTAKNSVTVKDGGTVALAGLVNNPTGPNDKSARETAIFVTAHLVHDIPEAALRTPPSAKPATRMPAADGTSAPATTESKPTERAAAPVGLESIGSPEETLKARELYANADSDPLVGEARKRTAEYMNATSVTRRLMDRMFEVQRGLAFLQQTLPSAHPAVKQKKALLATLQKAIEEKPKKLGAGLWESVRPSNIVFAGTLVSIRADQRLDAKTAAQAFSLLTEVDAATRASIGLNDLRASTVQQILQRLAEHMSVEYFEALLELLKSAGFISFIGGPAMCIQEDRPTQIGEPPSSCPMVLHLFGEVLQSEHAVLLDIQTAVKLTRSVPPPTGEKWNQANPPVSIRTFEWAGRPVIPYERHAVLPLGNVAGDAGRPSEVLCLIVKLTFIENQTSLKVVDTAGPGITATFTDADIHSLVAKISERTGVTIHTDATVTPTSVTGELVNASAETALRQVLKNTPYTFRKVQASETAYLVYRPISARFPGVELVQALGDLAAMADVPIVVDPSTHVGPIYAEIHGQTLEEALQIVLAGTPCVFKKMPHYYLVTAPNVASIGDLR